MHDPQCIISRLILCLAIGDRGKGVKSSFLPATAPQPVAASKLSFSDWKIEGIIDLVDISLLMLMILFIYFYFL
jgi:hypothetical protein